MTLSVCLDRSFHPFCRCGISPGADFMAERVEAILASDRMTHHCALRCGSAARPATLHEILRGKLMLMRASFFATVILTAIAVPAAAQPMAQVKTFTSSAEVQQLIAKAKADRKGDAPTTVEPILSLANYHANLEYRPIAGPAAIHDTENELMVVIEGTGTITMGGQMMNPKPASPSALGISGGKDIAVAKGDFIMVPHGTPHQISAVKGAPLVLMTLHMPQ